jgi:hypothetical protein
MIEVKLTLGVLFLAVQCIAQQQKEAEPEFPKTEEIQLVVTQAERAFEQYKQSVIMEATLPAAKQDQYMIEKDRELVEISAKLIAGLKQKPEAFHGLFRFEERERRVRFLVILEFETRWTALYTPPQLDEPFPRGGNFESL